MGWYMPTDITDHPCLLPNEPELRRHRPGEFWRCETCGDLWKLKKNWYYTGPVLELVQATQAERRRHKGKGFLEAEDESVS